MFFCFFFSLYQWQSQPWGFRFSVNPILIDTSVTSLQKFFKFSPNVNLDSRIKWWHCIHQSSKMKVTVVSQNMGMALKTCYLTNTLKWFLQIWLRFPPRLKCEIITVWYYFLAITQDFTQCYCIWYSFTQMVPICDWIYKDVVWNKSE